MKRLISILLVVTMLFALSSSAFAAGMEARTVEKQNRIDEIFKELNELALEGSAQNYAANSTYSILQPAERLLAINERESELDRQLETLGVHKVDPDSKEDLDRLGRVMLHAADASTLNAGLRAAPTEDPPNLEALTRHYSVYQYDENVYVDQMYYGSFVIVIDNNGYGGLTNAIVDARLCGTTSTVLSNLLKYSFNFGFSQFLGQIPQGWIADWLIGSVFTALNSYDGKTVVTCPTGSTGIYTMNMVSVTQMTYIYIYDPGYGTWVLCGSRAGNLSFSRTDCLAANIGGRAVTEPHKFDDVTSRTGESPAWYLQQYAQYRKAYNHSPGSFTINGMNGSTTFTPAFYQSPHLIPN